MKLCSIVPLNDLHLCDNNKFNMLLAHLCKYKEYVEWAKNLKGYKIMDNSIIELGNAFSFEDLIECALECEVDEIILPDVFKKPEESNKLGEECIIKYKKMIEENPNIKFPKLMMVCHGNNLEEFKSSFEHINSIKEINTIGIPKVTSTWCGNRSNLYNIFKNTDKEIHLLGCWYTLREIGSFSKEAFNKIRTIDTCLPALLSLTTDDPFIDRNLERTIDLENDKINLENYNKIMYNLNKEFDLE